MKYDRHSADYQVNMEALWELENCVPMTRPERDAVRRWVMRGYELESNPWDYKDADGWSLNFLQAYRLHFGYSSGPWDSWLGPDSQRFWDDTLKRYVSKDEI